MVNKILIFLFALLITNALTGQYSTKNPKKYTTNDGLLSKHVTSIFQDQKGFIWIGSVSGLNKYDGYNFTSYVNRPEDSTSLSNNKISHITGDATGNLWIATQGGGISKFDPVTETFKEYAQKTSDSTSISHNYVETIFVDSKSRIWAGHWEGLDLYNPEKDRFERVLGPPVDNLEYYGHWVFDITEDFDNKLWLATDGYGAVRFNPETLKKEKSFLINPEANLQMLEYLNAFRVTCDNKGNIWYAGRSGVAFLKKSGEKPILLESNKLELNDNANNFFLLSETKSGKIITKLSSEKKLKIYHPGKFNEIKDFEYINLANANHGFSLLEDNAGSLWAGGDDLIYLGARTKPFEYYSNLKTNSKKVEEPDFLPSKILADSNGFLWFEDKIDGLIKLNPKSGKWETFQSLSVNLKKDIPGGFIEYIIEDSEGNIWVFIAGKIGVLNPKTKDYEIYSDFIQYPGESSSKPPFRTGLQDKDGVIWIGTFGGILFGFDTKKREITYEYTFFGDLPNERGDLPGYYTTAFYEDKNDNLYVGFQDEGLFKLEKETNTFTKINYEIKGISNTNSIEVTCLYQNQKDILWIGTAGGLFKYNIKNKTSTHYGLKDGLPNSYVTQIIEDESGDFWLPTDKGLAKFNPKAETFKVYDEKDGLNQNLFINLSGTQHKQSNRIYLIGDKGFNVFNPSEIKDNLVIPQIVFTSFIKHNAKGEFVALPGINYSNRIKLPYNERDFTIEIAALDFTNPAKNKYAYWLEGYNTQWIEIGTRREITFTNLSPGNYTLRVKGSNNDSVWNEEGRSLQISILPPWWGTWWAYTFYAFAFLGLLYAAYRYRMNQLETVRLKELDEAKRTMYTNITHEFRTPLTVISGITKEIKEKSEGKFTEQTELIERNSKNMLYLVNQLLELRKLEIGKTKVDYIQADIMPYLKYIAESFKTYAKTKDISLHFVNITKQLVMDHDPDKLLMILSNLLSNAIKYSKPGDAVYLQVEELENDLQIRVVDSGKGIPEEKLPHIFDRFYKVQNKSDDNADGVGIGLAVTKELTELLGGTIAVESKKEQGTIFTVKLPVQNKAPLTKPAVPLLEKAVDTHQKPSTPKKVTSKKQPEDILRLLIIEDNTDIVHYLKSCLQEHWALEFASDGLKGIEKAIENVPDIILCDLMMPNANGYKVLEVLKNDATTSHIPIVILTAKADDESRIEAYKKGADAYLLKPFNKDELEIILQKLTEQRRRLQERYQTQASLRFAEGVEIHKEDTFINQLENLVLSEGSKSSYSIEKLCKDLGMSRTQLHNKIKALTGKSTSIFVRSLRLQKGKFLLEHTSKAISEIAYDVGFNNPSYFTKSFTEEFGIPPSSLRKE
jgi:signal transduction histidine kinase/ligand-binding sensor domain-containing protein/DNA-binding response OmpR family regulator